MRPFRRNPDEDLRSLERAAITGSPRDARRYLDALWRSGRFSPREFGAHVSKFYVEKRGLKEPPIWSEILRIFGRQAGHRTGLDSIEDAKRVQRLMQGDDWATVAGYEEVGRHLESGDFERNVEAVLQEIDGIIGTHGVEAVATDSGGTPGGSYWRDTIALFCNTGDGYDQTVCYDTVEDKFLIEEPNKFAERDEAFEPEDEDDEDEDLDDPGRMGHCAQCGETWSIFTSGSTCPYCDPSVACDTCGEWVRQAEILVSEHGSFCESCSEQDSRIRETEDRRSFELDEGEDT